MRESGGRGGDNKTTRNRESRDEEVHKKSGQTLNLRQVKKTQYAPL